MRTRKAFYNVTITMTYQMISIICGLITPRLILRTFGSTYNGVVASAEQLLSMISLLTLGIAGATRVALYPPLAKGDMQGVSRVMKANRSFMRKVSACVIVYALLLMLIYPFISHNDLTHLETAVLIGIVAIGTFADYFYSLSNQTLLMADQTSYILYAIKTVAIILDTLLTALLIWLGCSIFVVKLSASLLLFLSPMVMDIYVRRRYRLDYSCEPDHEALAQRGAAAFHSIANIIHESTDLVVLTVFTDAKVISIYTVYYLVIGKVKAIMRVFQSGMEGAFGNMWAKGERDTLDRHFRTYEFILSALTAVIYSCVGLLILPFIANYTSGVTDIEYIRPAFAVLMTVTEAVYCVRIPYQLLVQATGNYEATKNGAMQEAIINIVTSVLLVWRIGIEGVIIGTLLANVFRTVQYAAFVSDRILMRDRMQVVLRVLWLVGTSALICAADTGANAALSGAGVLAYGWLSWVLQAAVCFVIASLITLGTSAALYRGDLKNAAAILLRMRRR